MVSRFPFKGFVFILFFYSPHRWNKSWRNSSVFTLLSFVCLSDNINAFSSSGVCGSSVKMCRKEFAASWCTRKKGGWPMGHGSGQQQLSECEVQPQAKASLPFGINLTLLLHPHTCRTQTSSSPHSHLPSFFKDFALEPYNAHPLQGLPLALGWASTPAASLHCELLQRKCGDKHIS